MFIKPEFLPHGLVGPLTPQTRARFVVPFVSFTRSYHPDSPQLSAASKTRRNWWADSTVTVSLIPVPEHERLSPEVGGGRGGAPQTGGPAAAIVMLDAFCAFCPVESVNTIVNVDVPACVGVPAMAPDEAFILRP